MSLVVVIPASSVVAANAALQLAGFGPDNFASVCYRGMSATPSHAVLHTWDAENSAFAVLAMAQPGAAWDATPGSPGARTEALIQVQEARWGGAAPPLPDSGNALGGVLYTFGDDFWWCIQPFSRTTFGGDPVQYPALIRKLRIPGVAYAWLQPIDQFDAYQLVNAFTGKPDEVMHQGQRWVSQYANNVWEPGVFGWTIFEETP